MPEHAKGIVKKLIWGLVAVVVVSFVVFALMEIAPRDVLHFTPLPTRLTTT